MNALPRRPFWFLRHGQTDYNARGLSQGAVDIPLNETGRAQAMDAAERLVGRGVIGITASPMLRARETAELARRALDVPLAYEPDLREVVFGGMEGKPLAPWFGDWLDGRATPPGAETFADVSIRAAAVMGRILLDAGPRLIVSHGAFFRALRGLMRLDLDVGVQNAEPIYCEPVGSGWRASVLTR